MPCYSPYDYKSREELEQEASKVLFELKITTQFACECLTKLEKENSPIPEYIKVWWEKHKEWDRRRVEMEQWQKDLINEDRKKWEQISNAMENGIEAFFPNGIEEFLKNNS